MWWRAISSTTWLCVRQIHSLHENLIEQNPKQTTFPISTLDVSSETLQTGQFVAIVGFPLHSWDAAMQFGNIAATQTVNPNVASMAGLI
jgi:hypothetical protein